MSNELQKQAKKNKQHGQSVAYFQNCFQDIKTTVFDENTCY